MKGLSAIVPQHAPLLPPDGAVPEGQTAEGLPLYRLTQMRSRKVPDIDEATGKQRWALHPQNNMALYQLWKPELYEHTQLFYLESNGAFGVDHVLYAHPTEEEIAAEKRAKEISVMKDSLVEEMHDAGLSAADLVATMKAAKAGAGDEELPEPEVAEPELSEPEAPSY